MLWHGQGVQAAAGCAVAQHPGGNPQPDDGIQNGQLGPNYQAMSAFAKSAAKLSGKQLRSFSEASYKYLSSQYDTWRGGNAPPGSAIASAPGMPGATLETCWPWQSACSCPCL